MIFFMPLALALLLLLVMNIFWGQNWIDSDMSAEMVFSDLLGSTGHYIASPEWYYSTEFRILYTQLLFVPLLKICGSWALVRGITNVCFYAFLVLSYFFMMKGYDRRYVALSSVVLLLPFSETIAQHMQLGNTYMPHMILMFLCIGCVRRLDAKGSSGAVRLIWWGLLAFLSFICGASGVRYFMMIFAPLVLCGLWRAYKVCGIREGAFKKFKEGFGLFGIAFAASCAGLAGYVVNTVFIRSVYIFTTYESVSFVPINNGIWYERVASVIGCLLELFGYIPGGSVLSLRGVVTVSAFVMIFIMFMLTKRIGEKLTRDYDGAGEKTAGDSDSTGEECGLSDLFFLHYFLAGFAVMAFFLGFTDTTLTPRYFSTCMYMFLPLLAIWLEKEKDEAFKRFILVIFAGCIMLSTLKITYSLMTNDKNAGRREVARFIMNDPEKFGTRGYSFFEDSNVLMEMSDGNLTVSALTHELDGPFNWSTAVVFPEDKRIANSDGPVRTFLVLPEGTDAGALGSDVSYDSTVAGYDIYLVSRTY